MPFSTSALFALWSRFVRVRVLTAAFAFLICFSAQPLFAAQTDITGPAASSFGSSVTVLPNGNIVVTAPQYDIPAGATDVGAVYLYNGATLALISTLTGSTASDFVGGNGITVLTNGNYVVSSSSWDNTSPAATDVGAVTWCSATTGCSGVVSSSNSLIGGTASDSVGNGGITALTNGNYVVSSANWDNPSPLITNVGAVTWGNGTSGTVGLVSSSNSLIGGTASDFVGNGITALTNGNYVVRSPNWDNATVVNAGAVTFGSGTTGVSGIVSASNSLVGTTANDSVGTPGVTALTNGNYVVSSRLWDNGSISDAGAATFGSGTTGISGAVSAGNSLVGGRASDRIGSDGITPLANGNYVVGSQFWNAVGINGVGAVTWGSGNTGISGLVTSSNSLVGGSMFDNVGFGGVTALTNGNYVVSSAFWDNPSPAISNVGAATWGNGATGTVGLVSVSNSLIGGSASDFVGNPGNGGVVALTNGNYVVSSPNWDNPSPLITDVGAVTWGNGTTGITGVITSSNSLVGSTNGDLVGNSGLTALTNGNYVVRSQNWGASDFGAATWGNGTSGITGVVSSSNSLVGSTGSDEVGNTPVTALTNGNYVVNTRFWGSADVGAATWGNGTTGTSGLVSTTNSLVGSAANDRIGNNGSFALNNGHYFVLSLSYGTSDVGAITWGNGTTGTVGVASSSNSLVGSTANDLIGNGGLTVLPNGNFAIRSAQWSNTSPAVANASAVTFGSGTGGTTGLITDGATGGNSVVGTVSGGTSTFAFDATRNRLFVGRSASDIVSVLFFNTNATADGDLNNAANWDNGVPNGLVTGVIPPGRAMTISSVMNIGQIHVQCGGSLTGGSASAYIVGSVRRDFCGAAGESFTYPIGDANNYSPLNVTNANGTGNLTASVIDTFMPGLTATTRTLSRYWSLAGAGITANLTFNYVNADVNGVEGDYRLFRRPVNNNALITQFNLASVDPANNRITAYGVSQFSDWGVSAQPLAPTAAGVSVSGRVTTSDGRGLRNAVVTLTGSDGVTRRALSSSFGYYRFEDVPSGETYVINVMSKRFVFVPRSISVADELTDVDFVAQ